LLPILHEKSLSLRALCDTQPSSNGMPLIWKVAGRSKMHDSQKTARLYRVSLPASTRSLISVDDMLASRKETRTGRQVLPSIQTIRHKQSTPPNSFLLMRARCTNYLQNFSNPSWISSCSSVLCAFGTISMSSDDSD